MGWIIPLIASIISLALTYSLVKQYMIKKKTHQILYAISLFMFAIAAFSEFYAEAFGFTAFMYKLYYFSAITLVPVMAAGTVYILAKQKRLFAHVFLAYVVLLSLWLLFLIIPVQSYNEIIGQNIGVGGQGMPDEIRRFSFPLSGIGGIILIVGALFSYWKTKFKGNLYIAAGAIVMATGGRLATMGLTILLPLSELVGIILLYYGVVIHPASFKTNNANNTESSLTDAG